MDTFLLASFVFAGLAIRAFLKRRSPGGKQEVALPPITLGDVATALRARALEIIESESHKSTPLTSPGMKRQLRNEHVAVTYTHFHLLRADTLNFMFTMPERDRQLVILLNDDRVTLFFDGNGFRANPIFSFEEERLVRWVISHVQNAVLEQMARLEIRS